MGARGPAKACKPKASPGSRDRALGRQELAEAAQLLKSGLPQFPKGRQEYALGTHKCFYSNMIRFPKSGWNTPGLSLPTRIV